MLNEPFTPPGEHDVVWCKTSQNLLESEHFEKFLRVYNLHTAGTRANKENATTQDVLADRNLRNRMRAFFRDEMEVRFRGAKNAEVMTKISSLVDAAIVILDERNQKIRSNEIVEGEVEDERMLKRNLIPKQKRQDS